MVDSATSDHIIDGMDALQNVCKYEGEQHIQIANDSALPNIAIGALGLSLMIFLSPNLFAKFFFYL